MKQVAEIRQLLKPGMTVYVAGSCTEPHGLLDVFSEAASGCPGLHYIQQPLGAVNQRDLSQLSPEATQRCFFMTPFLRDGVEAGRVSFVPMHMRSIFDHLSSTTIDLALFQAARDRNGVLRYGPNVDYLEAALASARTVLVEENTTYVSATGAPAVDESKAMIIPADGRPPLYPVGDIDETSRRIGEQIAELIQDGDCLQTGIGAVPSAILENLDHRNNLGFHGGLMDEGVMRLIQNGNLDGSRKQIDPGRHVLGMALGSDTLLSWLATEAADSVLFRSANYTHDANVISQLDNFVSVNSAIEIDLMGQVNAEVVGGRQISGTGGSVDFMRAARMSRGGRSIVAMSATARKGTLSRIVPRVEVVTALRTDVDIVVTEFGVADIRNESLPSRAEKLIAIAHPDFRDSLAESLT